MLMYAVFGICVVAWAVGVAIQEIIKRGEK